MPKRTFTEEYELELKILIDGTPQQANRRVRQHVRQLPKQRFQFFSEILTRRTMFTD